MFEVEYRLPEPIKMNGSILIVTGSYNMEVVIEDGMLTGFVGRPDVIEAFLVDQKVDKGVIENFRHQVVQLKEEA